VNVQLCGVNLPGIKHQGYSIAADAGAAAKIDPRLSAATAAILRVSGMETGAFPFTLFEAVPPDRPVRQLRVRQRRIVAACLAPT
jgi:hypothetical protein